MADPLSIAASVVGLLAVGGKLIALLSHIGRLSDAPPLCTAVLAELSGTTSALAQIESFLNNRLEDVPRERQELVLLEHIATALTGCVMANADLDAALDDLGLVYIAGSGSISGVFDKTRWIRREGEIEKLSQRLQNHKATLNLILTVFQCTSTTQVRESVHRLCELVGSALASNSTLSQRISRLEGNSTVGYPDTQPDDETSDVLYSPQDSEEEPDRSRYILGQSFTFDSELESSKVYQKLRLISSDGHSATSMTSSSRRKIVASIFSTISLADISNISLYSLPIFLHEVGNSGWYIHVGKVSVSGGGIRVSDSMIVFSVKTLIGRRLSFTVAPTETVLDLKIHIQDKEGYPPDEIVLLYTAPGAKFVRLEDSRTFESYNLVSNPSATIEILLRHRDGGVYSVPPSCLRERKSRVEGGQEVVDVNSIARFDGG